MPELPEVEVVRRSLQSFIKGLEIKKVSVLDRNLRYKIRRDFDKAFEKVDILLTPTCPTTAFLKGDFVNDPLSMYLSDLLTVPVNLAGLPAISIPCGFDRKGLPIGLQLIGNVLEEHRILNAANIFEIDAQVMNNKPLI